MHDIKAIRENPDQFDKAVQRRGLEPVAGQIIALDKDRREVRQRRPTHHRHCS